jgi:hypothetical protein
LGGVASRFLSTELERASCARLRVATFTTARARDAKCNVERDSCSDEIEGEMVHSMTQSADTPKLSLRRWVNFELR